MYCCAIGGFVQHASVYVYILTSGLLSYPQTFWHRTKAPVFIDDEANELNALTEQPDGHDALHNFFKWLVINKELNRFHVILSSSDSFIHLWVFNDVSAHSYKTWVIGDLPEGEADQFWQQVHKRNSKNYPWCITVLLQAQIL